MTRRAPRGTHPLTLGPWLAAALAMLVAAPATAGTISLDTWYEFGFTDVGVPATGCAPDDPAGIFCTPSLGTPTLFLDPPAWTFTTSGSTLTVVDAFESGEAFEIFDFGVSLGLTSAPGNAVDCGDDPVPCLAVADMSKGFFLLAPGPHALTILPTLSPGGLGAAYLHVSAPAVPEPVTALLFGSGLVALGIRRTRRPRVS